MIDFPVVMKDPYKFFQDEASFCDHLMSQPDLWYRMGMHSPHAYRTHTTPDFLVHVRPERRREVVRKKPIIIGVEAELDARNFKTHGHDPYNIGLCVSFTCWWPIRHVKSVDVVSFYRKADDGWYHWSLDDDIGVVFHNRPTALFGRGSQIVRGGQE